MNAYKTPLLTESQRANARDVDVAWIQAWLNVNCGTNLEVDGVWGTSSRAEFISAMTCRNAKAITEEEMNSLVRRLGDVTDKRIKAIAKVESAGSGWFDSGLPKILYERHKFWKHVRKAVNRVVTWFANPAAGDYTMDANRNGINDSWEKLALAIGKEPLAALMSVSIGKFQVMGEYYSQCGYNHPIEMLHACSRSEMAQYELLVSYILNVAKILPAYNMLSTDPEKCRSFARAYNGVGYEKNRYHVKLAEAMR
jgi:putative phage-related cell wall hydrolase|nr:MAG TPA: N acetylmuramidase [Caudoviricetes sp.]